MGILINVNGELTESGQVSVFDRGYLYGDSLYEVCRTYERRPYALAEHLDRLGRSATLCKMQLSQPLSFYANEMQKTLAAFYKKEKNATEAYIRLIITRGEGKIGFGLNCVETENRFVVIVQPLQEPTAEQLKKGSHLRISSRLRNDARALDPAMKSGNYLNSLLAYLEASEEGFDDALMCNHEGHLTEGTTFNFAYIRRGIIATPPLDIGILEGITRKRLFYLAEKLGLGIREVRFPRERVYEADEVFLCSTIKEIFPVTQVDHHRIGDGRPGRWTMKLRQAFRQIALNEIKEIKNEN